MAQNPQDDDDLPDELGAALAAEGAGVDTMFASTYRELRLLARARLRGGGRDVVLDTTALVHETFLKLSANQMVQFPDRPRFLVYAGRVMRSVIVDLARQRATDRRGGDVRQAAPMPRRSCACTRR